MTWIANIDGTDIKWLASEMINELALHKRGKRICHKIACLQMKVTELAVAPLPMSCSRSQCSTDITLCNVHYSYQYRSTTNSLGAALSLWYGESSKLYQLHRYGQAISPTRSRGLNGKSRPVACPPDPILLQLDIKSSTLYVSNFFGPKEARPSAAGRKS